MLVNMAPVAREFGTRIDVNKKETGKRNACVLVNTAPEQEIKQELGMHACW
jgi:hypothetical protein